MISKVTRAIRKQGFDELDFLGVGRKKRLMLSAGERPLYAAPNFRFGSLAAWRVRFWGSGPASCQSPAEGGRIDRLSNCRPEGGRARRPVKRSVAPG